MPAVRVLLLAGALLAAAGSARAETFEVDGRKVRVRLDADWPAAMVGEPLFLSLTIENLGSEDLWYGDGFTRNSLGRPDFIRVETVRDDGTVLPVPDAGPGFGGAYGARCLRTGERQAKRLFLPHWAHVMEPGAYTLTCSRTWEFYDTEPGAGSRKPDATLDVRLSTRVEIAPWDPAKVPAMLDRWAWAVRGPSTDAAHEAVQCLCEVDDARVITLLESGIVSGYYDIAMPCIGALAKFEDDAALSGLKLAMKLDAARLKDVADPVTAAALLRNLRGAGAGALARSRNPDAGAVLRTFEEDPDPRVRLNVVHAAGRAGTPGDRELLRRRTQDPDELVRGEAERYLALLESK